MDHYEISESGRPDRLSRQALACSCGVSFSVGAPLPGCSWLAVLRVHALRNGLHRSGKRGIFKTHGKLDSSRYWNGLMVFWALPKQISALKRENLIANWQIGMRNWFFGKSVA